jgi:hypothetical protein
MKTLLLLLAACGTPPELEVKADWLESDCGELTIQVSGQTRANTPVVLNTSGGSESAQSDAAGSFRFELTPEEFLSVFAVAGEGSKTTEAMVYSPRPTLQHSANGDSRRNDCFSVGMLSRSCSVAMPFGEVSLSGGVTDGSLKIDGVQAPESSSGFKLPVPFSTVQTWDLSVFDEDAACGHLVIPNVEASSRGTTFTGEAWVGRSDAERVMTEALAARLGGDEPWAAAATGDVTMVVRRLGERAEPRLLRWDGDLKRLSDVKWVARITQTTVDIGSCGMYSSDSGTRTEVMETRTDEVVELIERATGRVQAQTTLNGRRSGCGSIAFSTSHRSEAPIEAVDAWLAEQLAAL